MAITVNAFPSVQRTGGTSRQLSEQNLTDLIKYINDTSGGSFVISESVPSDGSDFQFMLGGYYFCLSASSVEDEFDTIANSETTLYAYINVTGTSFKELSVASPYDSLGGVLISATAPASYTNSLVIASKDGGSWVVPQSSKKKYDGSRVYGVIDGNSPEA